jgi:tungstate transport system ATP-binding protein
VLAAQGLVVRRGGRVTLEVGTLEVAEGDLLAVLGPNGAGKSTLLRCLALLERPTEGVVRFRGEVVRWRDAVAYRRRTAMLLQEPVLLDTTVYENVALGLRLRGVARRAVRPRVMGWLERLGIAQLAGRAARTLSGGEARRVSLARALVLDPEVVFLDEPCAGLDAPTRVSFITQLAAVLDERRTTAVLVTHDQAEARALAHRVVVLLDGRVEQIGAVDEVLGGGAGPRVAAFLRTGELPARRAARGAGSVQEPKTGILSGSTMEGGEASEQRG